MPEALLPFFLIGPILLLLALGIVVILVRDQRRRLKQEKEKQTILAQQNELLEQQVQERTADLQKSLVHLQATQRQLVQSEKLASLGELTAGVAHEIQNPLNFVNNFAEVSVELVEELREEFLTKIPEADQELASKHLDDLAQTLGKITYHGQRAGSIVKGMLLHARVNNNERQLTDLNVIADQYLRLAYQGLRAKKHDWNAKLTTHFAPKLPLVNIEPQDIGRVLLNLFNNALYAVQKRQEHETAAYQPEVRVTTTQVDHHVEIRVWDNGMGIPEELQDKIYQPFFTTKPTGEGTGLGLSLSYDIITQGHNGTLSVKTEQGQYTEFLVRLPI